MNASRTIAVFSGNRAEYGLLYPLLQAIHLHPALTLQLYAGGDHTRLGTLSEIQADGLPIFKTLSYDATLASAALTLTPSQLMTLATADILPKMQAFFSEYRPDLFFVLGDRYESFAATLAAFYCNIPVAHLGGGDMTEGGCVDDTLRFMMSDLAHLHFAISEDSANRLLQRGEESWRVHISGTPAIDNIANTTLLPKEVLCEQFNVNSNLPIILFTQHPIPAEGPATIKGFSDSVQALANLGKSRQLQVIATCPNQDGFGAEFSDMIGQSKAQHSNIHWQESLGRVQYLSWMAACDAVVGNSSSGLIETPFFKKPSVTIGPRQSGRLRGDNVLSCEYGVVAVQNAVETALFDTAFIAQAQNAKSLFGDMPCADKICDLLAQAPPAEILLKKKYYANTPTPLINIQ